MVDAFPQGCNAQFPRYWTQAQNAFSKDWGREHFWVNARFSRMQDVVLKAIMDQVQGIMIVPVWKAHDWFWEVGEIALDWWDLPADQPVYQDNAGFVLPPSRGWTTRVVLFDTFSSNVRDSACDEVPGGYEGDTDTAPRYGTSLNMRPRGNTTAHGLNGRCGQQCRRTKRSSAVRK